FSLQFGWFHLVRRARTRGAGLDHRPLSTNAVRSAGPWAHGVGSVRSVLGRFVPTSLTHQDTVQQIHRSHPILIVPRSASDEGADHSRRESDPRSRSIPVDV